MRDVMVEFLLAHWFWAGLAAFSAAGTAWTVARAGAQVIDQADAVLWVKNGRGVYVDIRSPAEFANGRIADARNIPAAELARRAAEIDRYREKPVVVVCDNGMQSRKRARELADLGFTQARALRGGMAAWLDAQLPVFKK